MAINMPRGSIMSWNGNDISEHNRSALSMSVNRIEKSDRTANGTMRKYVVSDKRTFTVSWDGLPHSEDYTVDGKWGGDEIEEFYNDNAGAFTLTIRTGDGDTTDYTVVFTDFSRDTKKRGVYDFLDISITMEQV